MDKRNGRSPASLLAGTVLALHRSRPGTLRLLFRRRDDFALQQVPEIDLQRLGHDYYVLWVLLVLFPAM